jgi:hypothetical protein
MYGVRSVHVRNAHHDFKHTSTMYGVKVIYLKTSETNSVNVGELTKKSTYNSRKLTCPLCLIQYTEFTQYSFF